MLLTRHPLQLAPSLEDDEENNVKETGRSPSSSRAVQKLTDPLQHGSVPTSELLQKRSGHQRNETIHEIVQAASFGDVKTSVFDEENVKEAGCSPLSSRAVQKLTDLLQHGGVPTSELRQKRSGHQRNETIHEIVEAASFSDVKTSVFDEENVKESGCSPLSSRAVQKLTGLLQHANVVLSGSLRSCFDRPGVSWPES